MADVDSTTLPEQVNERLEETRSEPEDVEMKPVVENEPNEGDQDEEMDDLFGNDNDVEDARPDGGLASPSSSTHELSTHELERLPTPERTRRDALEYGEEEGEPNGLVEEVKVADVAFPNLPVPKSSDDTNWVIRMPNFVKVDSKPFHPDTYLGPEHDDEDLIQSENLREKSMTIKLKVENTVRWRWVKGDDGQDHRQSNSRIVRWSDGTLSLRLGKELFDINQTIDNSGAASRLSLGSQPQAVLPPQSKSLGLTYLVAQHKRAQVLQAEGVVKGYLSLRPTGMQSETHRMLVRAVGQKHNKKARLRIAPDPTVDPEKEVQELIKQSARKSKKKAEPEDGLGGGRRRRSGIPRKRTAHDVWSDDDDEGAFGDSDDDEEMLGSQRKEKKKDADEENKGGRYQEDDFLVADSDEEGEEESGGKKRRKHKDSDDEMEEDSLDKLDSKIEEQESMELRPKREVGLPIEDSDVNIKGGDDAEEMDIESEEEDEAKVRRPGAGSRKKLALNFGEEEEE